MTSAWAPGRSGRNTRRASAAVVTVPLRACAATNRRRPGAAGGCGTFTRRHSQKRSGPAARWPCCAINTHRSRAAAKSVETASNTPRFRTLLPFLCGGFVLISTLPAGLRQFAEYQPFTPVIQTIRGLLTGGPVGAHAIAAVAWSAGIALACYLWSIRLYERRRAADPK